jgi:hypothetical protein
MENPQVGTLFATAARETRDDLRDTAWRLFGRASNLAAHASGALAGQVDELGGRLSTWTDGALGTLTARAGDGLVVLGERLSGVRQEDEPAAFPWPEPDPVTRPDTRHPEPGALTSSDDTPTGH